MYPKTTTAEQELTRCIQASMQSQEYPSFEICRRVCNHKSTQASRYAGDRVRQCQTTNRTMRTDKPTKTTRNSLDKIQVSMVEGGSKASTRNSPDIIQVSVVGVELRHGDECVDWIGFICPGCRIWPFGPPFFITLSTPPTPLL